MMKDSIWLVQHVARAGTDDEDVKFVGAYSSPQRAQEAVERFATLPGFCKYPDGFSVDKYTLDEDHWSEGFGIA
jgi:hypothetical protein